MSATRADDVRWRGRRRARGVICEKYGRDIPGNHTTALGLVYEVPEETGVVHHDS